MPKLLYRDRYRIPSARLSYHDYTSSGWYFVTICTGVRFPWFGYIRNGIMCVNDVGSLAYRCWQDIPNHYAHVILDAFVVMPDHMHGVIRIINHGDGAHHRNGIHAYRRDVACNVSTSERKTKNVFSAISPKPQSLPAIIRSYKSAVTRRVHITGHPHFQWQPRFYDRIIRSHRELQYVRKYIINNPKNYHKQKPSPKSGEGVLSLSKDGRGIFLPASTIHDK